MTKYIFLSLSLVFSSLLFISGCGSGCNSGDGKKIGQIVKIGKHGVFCSTYEAELIRGGFNGGSGVNGTALDFTIKDKKLYQALVDSMENQQEIELTYEKRYLSGPCYSETNFIATGFRLLSPKQEVSKEESSVQTPVNWSNHSGETEKSQSLVRTDN
jgi:hypothetical protein